MTRCYQEQIETAPRALLTQWQSQSLKKQVKHAYDNVPFYRDLLDKNGVSPDDIESIGDITKLPFVTKENLREVYPDGYLGVPIGDCIRIQCTSGTTGKRIIAFYNRHDLDLWEDCCARAIVSAGGTKDDIVQISCAYGLPSGGMGFNGGSQKVGCLTVPISGGNTERQLEFMQDLKTTMICCTATYAAHLAEMIEEKGLKDKIHVNKAIIGSEPWTEEMRREIQERSGITVFDLYGITEMAGPGVAFECCEHNGMHVQEDHFYPEVIDPQTGKVLPDGEKGELVLSALTKEAFPLLRYRTRDICTLTHEKCKCGRTLVRMSKPMGRTDDMLIVKGFNLFPSQIETVLIKQGLSSNYQIILDRVRGLDQMEIQVEMLPENYTEDAGALLSIENKVKNALRSEIGITAPIRILAPFSLARSDGKAVRVVDKRKLY